MDTTIRCPSGIGIALFFAAALAAGSGCTPAETSAHVSTSSAIGFAISPSAATGLHVHRTRVLTSKVNLQEPLQLVAHGDDVAVTCAVRGHQGVTFTLDPSLATTASEPYVYEEHAQRVHPGRQLSDPERVKLRDGRTVGFRTDADTDVVVAQVFDADGTAIGPETTVSGVSAAVMSAPRAVTTDGRHVVVAFFATTEAGFDLVATSIDIEAP